MSEPSPRQEPHRPLRRFVPEIWGVHDEWLTVHLVLLVVTLFVVPPLTSRSSFVANAAFSLLLLSGVAAVSRRRMALVAALALVLIAQFLAWSGLSHRSLEARLAEIGSEAALFLLLTLLVFGRSVAPGPVTRHRVQGATAAFLLIGLTCALCYEMMETAAPGSFRGLDPAAGGEVRRQLAYFSFVTLTTVGYGDVTAVGDGARALATAEALLGQLYPALIIGSMISALPTERR